MSFEPKILEIHHSYLADTQRAAVLFPLVGHKKLPLIQSYEALRNAWLRRLNHLAVRDRCQAFPRDHVIYRANCPPFGVEVYPVGRTCQRVQWCPHCWARHYPGKLFKALRSLEPGVSHWGRITQAYHFPLPLGLKSVPARLNSIREFLSSGNKLGEGLQPVGGGRFQCVSLDCRQPELMESVELKCTVLAGFTSEQAASLSSLTCWRIVPATAVNLVKLVASTTRYPRSRWTMEAREVDLFCQVFHHVRWLNLFGACRNQLLEEIT